MKKVLFFSLILSILLCSCSDLFNKNIQSDYGTVILNLAGDVPDEIKNARMAEPETGDISDVSEWTIEFVPEDGDKITKTLAADNISDISVPVGTYGISVTSNTITKEGSTDSSVYSGNVSGVNITSGENEITISVGRKKTSDGTGGLNFTINFDKSFDYNYIYFYFTDLKTSTVYTDDESATGYNEIPESFGLSSSIDGEKGITITATAIPSGFYTLSVRYQYIDNGTEKNYTLRLLDPYIEIADDCTSVGSTTGITSSSKLFYATTDENSTYNGISEKYPASWSKIVDILAADTSWDTADIYFSKSEDVSGINFADYNVTGKTINYYWDNYNFCTNGIYSVAFYVAANGTYTNAGGTSCAALTDFDKALNVIKFAEYIENDTAFSIYHESTTNFTDPEISITKLQTNGELNLIVSDYSSLRLVSELSNAANPTTFENCNINIAANITKADTDTISWQPISSAKGASFKGTLDGVKHTINVPMGEFSDGEYGFAGIVGVNEGTIKNIEYYYTDYSDDGTGIVDCTGTSGANGAFGDSVWCGQVGGIAATNRGTIKNCWNRVNFSTSFLRAGGIAGWNDGTIENCLNTGDIYVYNGAGNGPRVGGIAGAMNGHSEKEQKIINCVNYGTVGVKDSDYTKSNISMVAGSICGGIYTDDTNGTSVKYITNCYFPKDSVLNEYGSGETADSTTSDIIDLQDYSDDTLSEILSVTGCGTISYSASEGMWTITAGTKKGTDDNCYTDQELAYGTGLCDALNGYVSENTTSSLMQWTTTDLLTIDSHYAVLLEF